MLVIFHTWRCFAVSVFSPGVSRHSPRWASSRAEHRHRCCPQPPSSEEKAVEGAHTCSQGGSEGFMCSAARSWAQFWGWGTVFPGYPLTTTAFILFFIHPRDTFPISSYACPSTLQLSQGHDTEPRHFPLPPGLSSHPFPLLLLFTNSCQMPLPSAFRVLSLEAGLPLTANPQSNTISRG